MGWAGLARYGHMNNLVWSLISCHSPNHLQVCDWGSWCCCGVVVVVSVHDGQQRGRQHGQQRPSPSYPHPPPGGLPIGAVLLKQHVADVMSPGDHGSTFAGNPLVCRAGCVTFDIINTPEFLQSVVDKVRIVVVVVGRGGMGSCMWEEDGVVCVLPPQVTHPAHTMKPQHSPVHIKPQHSHAHIKNQQGARLRDGLRARLSANPHVVDIRGSGLLDGVELDVMAGPVVEAAREDGLLVITAGKGNVVRMVPPLTVTEEEVDVAVEKLTKAIESAL